MSRGPVLIMAGGTGGHIFPGLAVAEALRAEGAAVAWLGARGGMEARLVAAHGMEPHLIDVHGLRGSGWRRRLGAPWMLLRATWSALRLLRRLRPRCVLSMGGYVAGPGGLAAWLLRRPLVVHEQNSVAGGTNRVLARLARTILCGFRGSLPGGRWVGNPVRATIAALPPPGRRLAERDGQPRLLVIGGSRGARALNEVVPPALAVIEPARRPQVWHQCGAAELDATRAAYAAAGIEARIDPFIDDMTGAWGWADLALCRAGALTLAELCAAGLGAILVPYPHAVDDHQTANARALVEQGAALLLPQPQLEPIALAQQLQALLADRARLLAMAEAAHRLARLHAAEVIAECCLEVAP
ncbi:MAG TPA: undecaprenyldiphospho-muramoylpentapeptide beta-N-acetylglucosaminyltransferase [Rhodanobacteraceae bacterium]|nr:undecaprenyldiphospho-muramoylpentapeptide beta-N-acetylglucosaminyltransferase [Rhodanobacteraceae bacterium]